MESPNARAVMEDFVSTIGHCPKCGSKDVTLTEYTPPRWLYSVNGEGFSTGVNPCCVADSQVDEGYVPWSGRLFCNGCWESFPVRGSDCPTPEP